MSICLAELCRPASPGIRRLLVALARRGVVSANGRVIASPAYMGEPPAGHDHVAIRAAAGAPPVGDVEKLGIPSVMAAETMAVVRDVMSEEADAAYFVEGNYAVRVADGTVSLSITTLGLVDHECRVVLS